MFYTIHIKTHIKIRFVQTIFVLKVVLLSLYKTNTTYSIVDETAKHTIQ
jgi:hypothetical protein